MKTRYLTLLVALLVTKLSAQEPPAALTPLPVEPAPAVETDDTPGSIIIKATGMNSAPAPLFFSARAETAITINDKTWQSSSTLNFDIVQGKAAILALSVHGDGDIISVTGEGIRDWAVRQTPDGRLLEIRPDSDTRKSIVATVVACAREQQFVLPLEASIVTFGSGTAVGFSSHITLMADPAVDVRIAAADGLVPVDSVEKEDVWRFQAWGPNALKVSLTRDGAALAPMEMRNAKLEGQVDSANKTAAFVLTGDVVVSAAEGGSIPLLTGHAAITEFPQSPDFRVRLSGGTYELTADKAGTFPVRLVFQAGMVETGDVLALDFGVPSGVVVPVKLSGFDADVKFDPKAAVYPAQKDGAWLGFLPTNGHCALTLRKARETEDGKLFFASDAVIEARIGAGLLRQTSYLDMRILQGKLDGLSIALDGPGEILSVSGANVLGWSVENGEAGKRTLLIKSGQAATGVESIIVSSQTPLGDFPLTIEPLRLTPEGAVRHSGYVRIASAGAVRLEVTGVNGMTQLAPEQFPAKEEAPANARQISVYRFPSASHTYSVRADQILPEIGVKQVVIYEMSESDRIISARVELDIREAPVREWELLIPESYAVVGAVGAEVSDYVPASEAVNGARNLKILFRQAVIGRQLIELRLEQNTPAAAGDWILPVLSYPNAKTVRGHIGVGTVAGYRVTPGEVNNVSEVPLAYFPMRVANLQQTFRLKDAEWSATMSIEAMQQSVQADVYHLYSLKEGITYGSVLVNYFVVGAPVSEWRLEVPQSIGNIAIDGEDVQGWRREGEEVIVTLHQPKLGAATLLVTFEQPMNARGGVLHPGEVKPLNVQGERGFLQVVSPSQVHHDFKVSAGLLKIEPLELPAEFRLLSNSPSLAVFQYAARPFDLELKIEWYEPGETVDQVVDYASLSSRISRDGQIVTEAGFVVKKRGRKALELTLPKGAALWEARVAGEVVNARSAEGKTLIPLPASLDPNAPVEVRVRIGETSANARSPQLSAPTLSVPTMFASWKISGDRGRLLVPGKSSGAEPRGQTLTESGFEWLRHHKHSGMLFLALAIVGGLALSFRADAHSYRRLGGIAAFIFAVVMAIVMAVESSEQRRVNLSSLDFAAPIVAPGETVTLNLKNVANWEAMLNWGGVALALVGGGLMIAGLVRKGAAKGLLPALGWVMVACGLLLQHFGAPLFFGWLGLFILFGILIPMIGKFMRARRIFDAENVKDDEGDSGGGSAPVTVAILLLSVLGSLCFAQPAGAADAVPLLPDSSAQKVRIEKGRLFADVDMKITGKSGEMMEMLRWPAVLTKFEGEGLRVTKRPDGDKMNYWLVLERDGEFTASASYEMAVEANAASLVLPAVTAAVRTVEMRMDQAGWEISSPSAVKTEALEGLPKEWSGVRLLLSPQGAAEIKMQVQSRDVSTEEAQFFAEVLNVFIPGPGLVDARHRVTVRPARGEMQELVCGIPEGFTVSNVIAPQLSGWRFDPEAKTLRLEFSPAVSTEFQVIVDTQQGSSALPAEATLSPLVVIGAANQVGMLALAFGSDAQPEKITAENLSEVALDDFDAGMLEQKGDAVLHQVWRYGKDGGSLKVNVVAVDPEVRVQTQQTLSIGEERLVLAVDVTASITRAGLFRLSFPLPEGMEIESASGEALSHWTESERTVTLHLNGRTSGEQIFAISLSGTAIGAQAAWAVPHFSINEATRQIGQLIVAPEQGIRAQPTVRSHVSQLDARTVAGNQPGTLAFRLLQADWELSLQLEALAPWVTAQALQEVLLREGITRTRLSVAYRVENAAVKALRVKLPGLTEEEQKTVRASGEAVSDIVRVADEEDVWELRFQRRILGNLAVEIEFQSTSERADGIEGITVAELSGVKQLAMWLAVRVSGRMDISIASAGQGWQRTDWPSVPRVLQDPRDSSVPALAFRAVQPEKPLMVKVQRHDVAEALSLRVSNGIFTTVFSPNGDSATEAEMRVEVTEKSTMRVSLPEGAILFNAFVNGESVAIVRESSAYLFHVLPPEEGTAAMVSMAWSAKSSDFELLGPSLNVPLQNITWRVALPDGLKLRGAKGSLDLEKEQDLGIFTLESYRDEYQNRRQSEANDATQALARANSWINQGDQQKARKALSRASKSKALDDAANEDARVQLRELQTQQAVVGLNTRRQKLYLDNKGDDPGFARNEQLEQAANINPLLKGNLNYNGQEVDSLLLGNTSEENSALQQMAGRIVSQQLAAEPALQAIDVTLPPSGKLLTFKRSVQVNGNAPLELKLNVVKRSETGLIFVLMMGLLLLGLVLAGRRAAA